jgi:hypothetical protein
VAGCWLPTIKPKVLKQMAYCEIHADRSGTEAGCYMHFFTFTSLIFPSLFPPSSEVCNSADQATHYHMLNAAVESFTSELAFGWSHS